MRTITEIIEEISRYMEQQRIALEGKLPAELVAQCATRQRDIKALLKQVRGGPIEPHVSGSAWTH